MEHVLGTYRNGTVQLHDSTAWPEGLRFWYYTPPPGARSIAACEEGAGHAIIAGYGLAGRFIADVFRRHNALCGRGTKPENSSNPTRTRCQYHRRRYSRPGCFATGKYRKAVTRTDNPRRSRSARSHTNCPTAEPEYLYRRQNPVCLSRT